MKRYELRVKTGTVDISHYLKKYICFYDIQDGYCTKIASSDNKDVMEKRFDKENEYRRAKHLTNNGIVYVVGFAVYDNETKDIIMQTAIDFKDIE
jgi:aspartyl/asparaginyl-tRNA synthetase